MHVSRLSPSPPSACARAVCLLVITTASMPLSHHLITSAPPPYAPAHLIRARDPTRLRNGRGLYSSSEGVHPRAKKAVHARRANRRAHRSITRLPAHCRLHRPSRQLRHASGRRLAGVGESSRQRLAGGSEQRRRLAAIAAFFTEADLEFLDELRDPSRTSLSAAAFATAARAAEEYKLGSWVRANNLDGTAIRTARLIVEYQRRIAEQPPPVRLRSAPWTGNSTGRNWAFRWRRSQGAMFGKLRIEADVTLPEKREKARGCVVTQWNSCFLDAGEFPKTRVIGCGFGGQVESRVATLCGPLSGRCFRFTCEECLCFLTFTQFLEARKRTTFLRPPCPSLS